MNKAEIELAMLRSGTSATESASLVVDGHSRPPFAGGQRGFVSFSCSNH